MSLVLLSMIGRINKPQLVDSHADVEKEREGEGEM